jgi:hypothetical protein
VATGSRSRAQRARKAAHGIAGVASWLGFAALWTWQILVNVPANWPVDVVVIAGTLALFGVLTPLWVGWNRNIYRRRHRRTTPISHEVDFTRDKLGRRIVAERGVALGRRIVPADTMIGANPRRIRISLSEDGTEKHYAVEAGPAASARGDEAA